MTFQEWFDAAALESFITKKPISQQDIWDAAKRDACREREECDHVIGFYYGSAEEASESIRASDLSRLYEIDERFQYCPNCGAKLDVNADYAAERATEAMGLLMRQDFVLQPWAKMGF